jgi:hypothetical protein
VANRHYAKIADVWKHLPLAELLAVERPRRYLESHAGSALYPLTRSPERDYGVRWFLDHADASPATATSAYRRLLVGLPGDGGYPLQYPGSAMLAMLQIGRSATYLLCDTDPESVASLRKGAEHRRIDSSLALARSTPQGVVAAFKLGDMATTMELVEQLQTGARDVADYFKNLEPLAATTMPITPSEHPGGRPWTPKDHLAHLVARELDFLEIARRVAAREPNPLRLEHRGSTSQERAAYVHRENQVNVEERGKFALADLLEELLDLRSQLVSITVELGQHVPAHALLGSSDRHAQAHIQLLRATAQQ